MHVTHTYKSAVKTKTSTTTVQCSQSEREFKKSFRNAGTSTSISYWIYNPIQITANIKSKRLMTNSIHAMRNFKNPIN